ncbi:nicotinate dehydrogenase subunit B [Nitrobacteraceae bacterium AZCC 2161]
MNIPTHRRDFLKGTGALIVSFSLPALRPARAQGGASAAKTVSADEVDGFIRIDHDGAVTLYSGKVDLGTGVRTAMTQIVAEELDVPIGAVSVIEGDTALTPDQGTSSGSNSIQFGGVQIRLAAATARRALLQQAAAALNVDIGDLMITDGVVTAKSTGKTVKFGELIGDKAFALKVDKAITTKTPADFKIVGKSVARLDIPAKVMAQFTYMQDYKMPGMLHGRVVRPPGIGATLQSVDEASVSAIPGFVKVVRVGNFVGVVAESEWGAIKAAQQLKTVWSKWEGLPDQAALWDHVRNTKIVKDDVTSNIGDASAALAQGVKRLKATYDFAIHTHGSIGPSCAVVEIKDGKLTCWTASQATHNLRKQLSAMLSMPVDDVRCIYIDGSGCYGRNGHEDAAADAALMARAVGRPVRVQWMRADEHGWDPKGPPTLVDLEAALDASGNIVAWSSSFFHPQGVSGTVELVGADLAALPHENYLAPGGVTGNSALGYTLPNVRTVAHRLETTPFKPSWIRTPGRLQNTFANEAFFDELASAAGVDPLEYRLRYLKDPRGIELLERLAKLAKWDKSAAKPAANGDVVSGRGISYVKYELVRTYVGAVADVEVNKVTGAIKVRRIFVVQDCGQIINPDGVRNQIEGNMVQTLSRTLMERVTFDRANVTSLDWGSYPIITFPDVPEVVIDLIDRPNERPWGAGEPSASIVPSAVSNAVFDAVGARLRSVPFLPDKVKTAMRRA